MAKKKLACASCGGSMKPKMKKGGVAPKPFAAGIPYAAGGGQTDGKNGMMRKGGAVKKKLAALAPPTNKVTRADIIAGALKNKRKKK